jgi:FG-GAP-like repeat/Bacterial Ig-like domain (group 3)
MKNRAISLLVLSLLALSSAAPAAAQCTFSIGTPAFSASGEKPGDIVSGDFNHDGYLDLAVVNRFVDTVSILLGNVNGTFAAPFSYPTGTGALDIGTTDLNLDGHLDLIVVRSSYSGISPSVPPGLDVFLGVGNGTFTAGTGATIFQNPTNLTLGDFNEDGRVDVATTRNTPAGFAIHLSAGNGTLTPGVTPVVPENPPATGTYVEDIASGDFDNDGHLDLALVERIASKVWIYFGIGNGTFTQREQPFTLPNGNLDVISVASADFNADGYDDIAVYHRSGPSQPVRVINGGAARVFTGPVEYGSVASGVGITVGDVDLDGDIDIIVVSTSLEILRNNGTGAFPTQLTSSQPASLLRAHLADVDRDGANDIVFGDFVNSRIGVLIAPCGNLGVSITSSLNPANQGTDVTLTGAFTTSPVTPPTGTLTLRVDGTLVATTNLPSPLTVSYVLAGAAPGNYAIRVDYSGDARYPAKTHTIQQTIQVPPFGPPPRFTAFSTGGPVSMTWIATAGVDHYQIWRNIAGTGWAQIGTSGTNAFTDNGASPATAYLYKVRGIAPGGAQSDFSTHDLASTFTFTDETLLTQMTLIKRTHLTELRNAIDAARATASLAPFAWTEAVPTTIKAIHWGEARTALAQTRATLGLAPMSHAHAIATGLLARTSHVAELRVGVR